MTITNKQKAILHVAKGKLGLSDPEYRAALVHVTGATSSTELDKDGFDAMMGLFEYLGFEPLVARGPDYGDRPGMASFAQIELIRALWSECTDDVGEVALNKWLLRSFKLSSLRFLKKPVAAKVITALKMMKSRAALPLRKFGLDLNRLDRNGFAHSHIAIRLPRNLFTLRKRFRLLYIHPMATAWDETCARSITIGSWTACAKPLAMRQ